MSVKKRWYTEFERGIKLELGLDCTKGDEDPPSAMTHSFGVVLTDDIIHQFEWRVLCTGPDIQSRVWGPDFMEEHAAQLARCQGTPGDIYARWTGSEWHFRSTIIMGDKTIYELILSTFSRRWHDVMAAEAATMEPKATVTSAELTHLWRVLHDWLLERGCLSNGDPGQNVTAHYAPSFDLNNQGRPAIWVRVRRPLDTIKMGLTALAWTRLRRGVTAVLNGPKTREQMALAVYSDKPPEASKKVHQGDPFLDPHGQWVGLLWDVVEADREQADSIGCRKGQRLWIPRCDTYQNAQAMGLIE